MVTLTLDSAKLDDNLETFPKILGTSSGKSSRLQAKMSLDILTITHVVDLCKTADTINCAICNVLFEMAFKHHLKTSQATKTNLPLSVFNKEHT